MYVDAPPGTYRELLQKSEHVGFHDTCSLLCVCVCDLISIFLPFTWLKISLGVKHMDADHLNRQNILRLENLINSLWTVLIRISQKDLFKNEFKSIAQAYIFLDQDRWDTAERWMPCYFFLSWNVHVRWNLKKKNLINLFSKSSTLDSFVFILPFVLVFIISGHQMSLYQLGKTSGKTFW